MNTQASLSPSRNILCSHRHALQVARCMATEGLTVSVVSTCDPLQPWRIVEQDRQEALEQRACA